MSTNNPDLDQQPTEKKAVFASQSAFFLALGSLLLLFSFAGRAWRWWDSDGTVLIPAGRVLAIGAVGFLCLGLISLNVFGPKPKTSIQNLLSEIAAQSVFALGLVALFVSDWLTRPYNLFQGPLIRGELITASICAALVIWFRQWWIIYGLAIITPIILIVSFFTTSDGALLFSDDHAMFLLRMFLLRDNFPWIPFWSPLWNAGIDARDFFATGSLNVFFLTWPLLYTFSLPGIYNVIVAAILFFFVPLFVALAAKIYGASKSGISITVILALSSNLVWYRWALKYGTLGFITSASLVPLIWVLLVRFNDSSKSFSRSLSALFIISGTLMAFWSPSIIVFAPLVLLTLINFKSILSERRKLFVIAGFIIINLPWILMLWSVSSVSRFLTAETTGAVIRQEVTEQPTQGTITDPTDNPASSDQATPSKGGAFRHGRSGLNFKKALSTFQEHANSMNPLLLVFAIPAILVLRKPSRLPFLLTAGWLLFLGTVGVTLKPQLELDRMLVILGMLLTIPVGELLGNLFLNSANKFSRTAIVALTGGFLFLTPLTAANIVENRSIERYFFANGTVTGLVNAVKREAGSGRGLFTGSILHELSGGHLAPLVYLDGGVPLVASSYAHNIWHYVQIIPESFLSQGDVGIRRFFDLMNASVVFAHEPYWRTYFNNKAQEYTPVWHADRFTMYRRNNFEPTYFEEGSGAIESQKSNSVTLKMNSANGVIRFRYFPFLESSACKISGRSFSPDLTLIELTECPLGVPITLRSVPPWKRLIGMSK